MWDNPLCSFWSSGKLCHGWYFCPISVMNPDLDWGCTSRNLHLGSILTSWMSCWCAIVDILGGLALLGKITAVPRFFHVWITALTVVCWSIPIYFLILLFSKRAHNFNIFEEELVVILCLCTLSWHQNRFELKGRNNSKEKRILLHVRERCRDTSDINSG